MMLDTEICQVGGRARIKGVRLGKDDSTEVKAERNDLGGWRKAPSNPWGTGLRMEYYYSVVRRGLHFLLEVFI